jgi:hypothetical protein
MTPQYFGFMEDQLAALHAQTPVEEPMPTPKFFAPPPAARGPAPQTPSSLVSAPVSRDVPGSNGRRSSPGRITLTPAEVEAARVAGVDLETYARERGKYQAMLASGEYRDGREGQR